MPWCEQCDTQLADDELTDTGTCPTCHSTPIPHRKALWWFKFVAVATVIYLGYRAFQGVTWVVHHV